MNKYFRIINNKIYGANASAQGLYFTIDSGCNGPLIDMTDLVAYYKLDGNMDDYTTNYNGTASSASILDEVDGKFNGGAYFSPSNVNDGEYITLGNLGNLEEPFTVSGWYKSGGSAISYMWHIGGDSTASSSIGGYGVSSYFSANGALDIEYRNGGINNAGGRRTYSSATGVVPMNEWVHIAIYVDGLGSHKVYINGVLTSVPYSSGSATSIVWGDECSIGCRIVVGLYQTSKDLYMDDVSIWNRELAESEVIKLYGNCPLDSNEPEPADISGGIKTIDGLYTVHTFKEGDTFNTTIPLDIEYLIVGGGGNGGVGATTGSGRRYGGGGGAGGLLTNIGSPINISAGSYPVVVGNGGQDSSFNSLTAVRGGKGGAAGTFSYQINDGNGGSGGSGGGGGSGVDDSQSRFSGGAGTPGQGNGGGQGGGNGGSGASGGGASGAGISGSGNQGSVGANGIQININGTPTYYAGGGGGAGQFAPTGTSGLGTGPNTGGGGNGVNMGVTPQAGHSGIVIIRYLTP